MTVSVDQFAELDFRIGTIVEAEPVPKANKLLKVVVDIGDEQRTLVAGVAQSYEPDALIGLQVVVVANLEPAVIRGIGSQGMMLGVGCDNPGEVSLITTDRHAPNGARVM